MFRQEWENIHCSGIQLWKNTDTARKMIQAWWDSSTSKFYNKHHDFEQSVVRKKHDKVQDNDTLLEGGGCHT